LGLNKKNKNNKRELNNKIKETRNKGNFNWKVGDIKEQLRNSI
jgi:hypothetical protein